jgi:hypothetical protein
VNALRREYDAIADIALAVKFVCDTSHIVERNWRDETLSIDSIDAERSVINNGDGAGDGDKPSGTHASNGDGSAAPG